MSAIKIAQSNPPHLKLFTAIQSTEGGNFRQENEGLMRKTGVSVCLVESGSPVF
jgi:hypothetical protein